MISHFANPDCGSPFHSLRGGRLYRFDLRRPLEPCLDVPNAICASKPSHASVYFWLCRDCARKFAVRFSPRAGLSLSPLDHPPESGDSVVARAAETESI